MLATLPVELVRRTLALAAPTPARSPSFDTELAHRQRFLCALQRVCKVFQGAARELVWGTVRYNPKAPCQFEHLLKTTGDEGSLVRHFEFERFQNTVVEDKGVRKRVPITKAVRKTPGLVSISIHQNVEGGALDLGVLSELENLKSLHIQGTQFDLILDGSTTPTSLAFPSLTHLVLLNGVTIPPTFWDALLTTNPVPALKTLCVSRLVVKGVGPRFPSFPLAFLSQLDVLQVGLWDYSIHPQDLYRAPSRPHTVVRIDEPSARTVLAALADDEQRGLARAYPALSAHCLLIGPDEIELDFPGEGISAPALALALQLVEAGTVDTLFLPRACRVNGPMYHNVDMATVYTRQVKVGETYDALFAACEERGVEMYFTDDEGEVERWPEWAKGEPGLRWVVEWTEERDAGVQVKEEAAATIKEMLFGGGGGL
ncbi:hypothetical protein JCM9279_004980 [Rhodotorula babjevae]